MKMAFEENLAEELFFKPNKKYFRWVGMWPEDNIFEWKNLVLCSITFVTLLIIGTAQCAYSVYNISDDLYGSLEVICQTSYVWVSGLKLFILFCLRQKLKIIIIKLRKAWFDNQSEISVAVNTKMVKWAHTVAAVVIVSGFISITTFILVPMLYNIQRLINGQSYMRVLSFKSKYPFRTDTSPNFELTYIFASLSGYAVVLAYGCVDGIFITLCVYISAQFKIVQQSLLHLNEATGLSVPTTAKKYSKLECEKLLKNLSRIIQRHVDTIKLTNDVSEIFILIILIQFFTAALNFGIFVCLLKIFANQLEVVSYSCTFLMFLAQLYIYCHGGTLIMKNSAEIADAAYEFNWYLCDKRVGKTIGLIILRAQKESYIKIPLVDVSANTFLNILSKAASYITIVESFL